jgi:hypothetical protein
MTNSQHTDKDRPAHGKATPQCAYVEYLGHIQRWRVMYRGQIVTSYATRKAAQRYANELNDEFQL